jgi:hypothetical protein
MSTNGATPWFEVSVDGLIEFDKRQSGVSFEDELNELEIQREANEALEEDCKFAQAIDIDFDAVGAL